MSEITGFEKMLKENNVLVSIETVKIKDFIFSTNKLKLIRGASYLLDYMNQVEVPEILGSRDMEFKAKELVNDIYDIEDDGKLLEEIDSKIDEYISRNILYIGAGNAKFLVENEEEAQKICKEIKDLYNKMAPGVKVVAEYVSLVDENNNRQKIWDAIDQLAQITAEKKSEGFPILNIDLPFAVKCDLSGTEPAVVSYKNIKEDLEKIEIHQSGYTRKESDKEVIGFNEDGDNQIKNTLKAIENVIKEARLNISEESAVKIKYSNKMIKDDVNEIGFYSIIKKALNEDIHLNTEIDDYEVGDSFIGFVYSDGDSLGDFLKNTKNKYTQKNKDEEKKEIESEIDYIKFMRKFSVILDRNTKYVLKEIIKEMYEKGKFKKKKEILKDGKPKYIKVNGKEEKEKKTVIGEFLIVGGDDVCAVFPADLAIEISAEFQRRFEEKMKKFAEKEKNSENITSSGGVVIAKSKTPMFQLFDQGINLQKSAKLRRYNINNKNKENNKNKGVWKTGYIDFQVIGSEGNVDIKGYRSKWFDEFKKDKEKTEKAELYISQRPYCINSEPNSETGNNKGTIFELIERIRHLKKEGFPNTKIRYIFDLKKDETKSSNEKIMEAINILSKMDEKEIKILNKYWNLNEKLELSFENKSGFDSMFEDIFDILELYDFVRETEILEKKEDNTDED